MQTPDAVRNFIELEADILDFKQYSDWLDLWDEGGIYIVPVDAAPDGYEFEDALNFAYDDAAMRQLRVQRLLGGEAVSSETTLKTVRSVSRLRILSDADGVIDVRSAQFIAENRHGNLKTYPADVEYRLRREGDTFLILRKIVRLLNSHNALASIGYIL